MRKFFGYILTPLVGLAFFLSLIIFQPIQWICYKFFGYEAHKRSVDLLNLCLMRSFYLAGDTATFTNKQKLPAGRPLIIIANHQSMVDIPAIIWYMRKYHAKFIAKKELTKGLPSISFNLKYGGGANIDRKDSQQSRAEIAKLAERMHEKKWSAVIFPEGTRSKDGKVKPFYVGGIETILQTCPEALLVPIAINNSWRVVQYGNFPLSTFEHMTWDVLEPIEPAGRPAEELVKEAENKIKAYLHQV